MNSISSANLNIPSNFGSFFNALGGNAVGFGDIFNQALSQAKTPADAAKVDWLQAEYSDLMDLTTMSSGTSALGGLGMGNMFSIGAPMGLPTWALDAEKLLGNNPDVKNLVSLDQQAAFMLQSQFNQSLANFGSTGGTVNSLF